MLEKRILEKITEVMEGPDAVRRMLERSGVLFILTGKGTGRYTQGMFQLQGGTSLTDFDPAAIVGFIIPNQEESDEVDNSEMLELQDALSVSVASNKELLDRIERMKVVDAGQDNTAKEEVAKGYDGLDGEAGESSEIADVLKTEDM